LREGNNVENNLDDPNLAGVAFARATHLNVVTMTGFSEKTCVNENPNRPLRRMRTGV
jgi:hypothetical protein